MPVVCEPSDTRMATLRSPSPGEGLAQGFSVLGASGHLNPAAAGEAFLVPES